MYTALFFCSSFLRKQTAFEAYEDSFSRNSEDDEEEEEDEEEWKPCYEKVKNAPLFFYVVTRKNLTS